MAIKLALESLKAIGEEVHQYQNGNDQEQERACAYLNGVLAVAHKNDDGLAGYIKAVLEDDDLEDDEDLVKWKALLESGDSSEKWDGAWPDPVKDDIDAEFHAAVNHDKS